MTITPFLPAFLLVSGVVLVCISFSLTSKNFFYTFLFNILPLICGVLNIVFAILALVGIK